MKQCLMILAMLVGIANAQDKSTTQKAAEGKKGKSMLFEVVTLGNGCFWCTEAVFQRLEGVVKVESGYSGGTVANPSYEEVCTGRTGHAEVLQVTFDPKKITFKDILDVFWKTHDPTTLNRQGNDAGTQYRSAVFYHSEEQKKIAEEYKKELESVKIWDDPIVTEITSFKQFYKAENYHQNYYNSNKYQPYCMMVINPKLKKFQKQFESKLKNDK